MVLFIYYLSIRLQKAILEEWVSVASIKDCVIGACPFRVEIISLNVFAELVSVGSSDVSLERDLFSV